jgi:hypothetical protein
MPKTTKRRDVEKYRLLPPLDPDTYAGLKSKARDSSCSHLMVIGAAEGPPCLAVATDGSEHETRQ